MSVVTPDLLLAAPGLARVVPALAGLAPAHLVGGAVRDLLRGAVPPDLDLAVDGHAEEVASTLAERLGGEVTGHDRFGTATLRWDGPALDVARTRRERYPRPGALPEVEPAPLEEDLRRRDFTVNALAVALNGPELGRLTDPLGGRADLAAGTVRVLHPASFTDDPTRLLRAVRYEVRLGGRMDPGTEGLARAAAASRALDTVSGARVRDELLDLLAEAEAEAGVARLSALELDRALDPHVAADSELTAAAALGALETGADPVLARLAALVTGDVEALAPWVERLTLGRERSERVVGAARRAPGIARALTPDITPSALHHLLAAEHAETLALARALGAAAEPVLRWVAGLRDVRLAISGDELRAAGVEPSPALGHALAATLDRKLDGEVDGHDEELALALRLARGEDG